LEPTCRCMGWEDWICLLSPEWNVSDAAARPAFGTGGTCPAQRFPAHHWHSLRSHAAPPVLPGLAMHQGASILDVSRPRARVHSLSLLVSFGFLNDAILPRRKPFPGPVSSGRPCPQHQAPFKHGHDRQRWQLRYTLHAESCLNNERDESGGPSFSPRPEIVKRVADSSCVDTSTDTLNVKEKESVRSDWRSRWA
jgi:hypothetical protein